MHAFYQAKKGFVYLLCQAQTWMRWVLAICTIHICAVIIQTASITLFHRLVVFQWSTESVQYVATVEKLQCRKNVGICALMFQYYCAIDKVQKVLYWWFTKAFSQNKSVIIQNMVNNLNCKFMTYTANLASLYIIWCGRHDNNGLPKTEMNSYSTSFYKWKPFRVLVIYSNKV